jgi:hypothetical protein
MYMHPLLLINLATNTESFSTRLFTHVMWRVKSILKILRKYLDIAKILFIKYIFLNHNHSNLYHTKHTNFLWLRFVRKRGIQSVRRSFFFLYRSKRSTRLFGEEILTSNKSCLQKLVNSKA